MIFKTSSVSNISHSNLKLNSNFEQNLNIYNPHQLWDKSFDSECLSVSAQDIEIVNCIILMYPAVRLTGLLEPASNMHGTTFMFAKHSHTLTRGSSSKNIYFMALQKSTCRKTISMFASGCEFIEEQIWCDYAEQYWGASSIFMPNEFVHIFSPSGSFLFICNL